MSSRTYKPVSLKLPVNQKVQTSSSVVAEYVDTRCGFWMCKPACLQPLARIASFVGFYSLANFMSQTLTQYVNSQVTTLERQFGFSSYQTGIILAANDIGYLVCVLFVSYIASRTHIPRSLGIAMITYGISGIACALPHFLFGASMNKDPTSDSVNSTESNFSKQSPVLGRLCDIFNNTKDPCVIAAAQKVGLQTTLVAPENVAGISLIIIVIGMSLQGFAKAPRLSFTMLYVDDNTARVNTGFYTGIIITAAVLGPAAAFLVGGVFSRMYVTLEATKLTPSHPKWIGAWWLGFVVFGVISLIVSIPLFCFPRKMPRGKNRRVQEGTMAGNADLANLVDPHTTVKQTQADKMLTSHTTVTPKRSRFKSMLNHVREFLATVYRLLVNPVYLCTSFQSCFLVFMVSGNMSFFSKYLERMFHLPIHTANYITAAQLLCTTCVGTFTGGVLSRRYKMTALAGLLWIVVMLTFTVVCQLLCFIFLCDQPTVNNWPGEENACNGGCNCRDNSYFPICGGDGKTYYSPCHAGCLQADLQLYQNCSCISGGHARRGTCDYNCSHLYGYVIVAGLRNLFLALSFIPKMIVYIRCVDEADRPMALAVFTFMSSLFGWLLAPIIFGNVIDSACLIWDIKCLTRGRCLLYNNSHFRVSFHGYGALGLSGALISIAIAYLYARWTRCLDTGAAVDVVPDTAEMKPGVNGDGTVNT